MLRYLTPLILIIQITFAIHAFKNGKDQKWIWIIMFAPVVGCLAYYFMEVFAGSRDELKVRQGIRDIAKALNPDAELKRRAEALKETDSVENKGKLAEECLAKGMFEEAIRLYLSALTAQFENDAKLTLGLARAYFYNGQFADAKTTLERLARNHPKYHQQDVELLLARTFAELGNSQEADRLYQALSTTYVGLEAKYRYAQFLKGASRLAEANEQLDRLIELGSNKKREMSGQQEWLALAKKERLS